MCKAQIKGYILASQMDIGENIRNTLGKVKIDSYAILCIFFLCLLT